MAIPVDFFDQDNQVLNMLVERYVENYIDDIMNNYLDNLAKEINSIRKMMVELGIAKRSDFKVGPVNF